MKSRWRKYFIVIAIFLIILLTLGLSTFHKISTSLAYKSMLGNDVNLSVSVFSRETLSNHKVIDYSDKNKVVQIESYIGTQYGFKLPFIPKGSYTEQILYSINVNSIDGFPKGNIVIISNIIIFNPLIGNDEAYYIISNSKWEEILK